MSLRTYLTDIADAIREKKGTSDPINAQDFASEIASISTGGGGEGDTLWKNLIESRINYRWPTFAYLFSYTPLQDFTAFFQGYNTSTVPTTDHMFWQSLVVEAPLFDTSGVTNMQYMFAYCSKLTTVPLYNTSSVTNMSYMFSECPVLTTVPLLDTSNVTNMSYMFNSCYQLATLPQFNTSKVIDMSWMFWYCSNMTQLPPIDTSKATNLYRFIGRCTKLTEATINTDAATNIQGLAENCWLLEKLEITNTDALSSAYNSFNATCESCLSLTKLIIRNMTKVPPIYASGSGYGAPFKECYHFTGTQHSVYNPDGLQDGRIYVPDAMVDTLKAATHWSYYADLIVPLSTLVED